MPGSAFTVPAGTGPSAPIDLSTVSRSSGVSLYYSGGNANDETAIEVSNDAGATWDEILRFAGAFWQKLNFTVQFNEIRLNRLVAGTPNTPAASVGAEINSGAAVSPANAQPFPGIPAVAGQSGSVDLSATTASDAGKSVFYSGGAAGDVSQIVVSNDGGTTWVPVIGLDHLEGAQWQVRNFKVSGNLFALNRLTAASAAPAASIGAALTTAAGGGSGALPLPLVTGAQNLSTTQAGLLFDTSAGGGSVALPPLNNNFSGQKFLIQLTNASLASNPVIVTPHAADKINGVNAPVSLNVPGGGGLFTCTGNADGWLLSALPPLNGEGSLGEILGPVTGAQGALPLDIGGVIFDNHAGVGSCTLPPLAGVAPGKQIFVGTTINLGLFAVTVNPQGADNILGRNAAVTLNTLGGGAIFTATAGSQGWQITSEVGAVTAQELAGKTSVVPGDAPATFVWSFEVTAPGTFPINVSTLQGFEVIDVIVTKNGAVGVAGDTVQVQQTAGNVTEAISLTGATANTVLRNQQLIDKSVAGGAALEVSATQGAGGDCTCSVRIICQRS